MYSHALCDGSTFIFTTPAKLTVFLPFPMGALASSPTAGFIRVESTAPLNVRGLRVRFSGQAHVRWTTGSGKNRHTHDAKQDLVVGPYAALFGADEECPGADYMLLPGVRDFPFTLPLVPASGLPSTCALSGGRVRYAVEAWLDVRGHPDLHASAELSLVLPAPPPPPLAALPMPQRAIVPLHTFWCCGDAGVARLTVALPPGGHVLPAAPRGVQQPLPFFAGVGVAPTKPMPSLPEGSQRVGVALVRRVVCRSGAHTHETEEKVGFCMGEGVAVALLGGEAAASAEKEGGAWDGAMALQAVECIMEVLDVPSFSCSVMEVSYALRLHLAWPWTTGPTLEVPLWVGVPLFANI